ncbi:methylmalonyl-CoA mutase [Microvirga ossetica]|uniref:Methylmalonyl-CoA mutase n=1 Tax=Microvirga ossetica TaxID=1882682 RepID=A0A1B2ECI6_9HYPH|nr:methylmalonyl-CoA mutase family protein [Microvirga ossetica]ANY77647.1 methylmalonyl-CoA mutase [Microvirga ossetica]
MDDLNLASDFPQATREQWLERVEGVLKGADFRKKLVARTHDGIEIQPLYPKAEGSAPVAREQAGRWRVSQRIDHPEPAKANELALLDLEGGADCLNLILAGAPSARGFGVGVDNVEDLDRTLSGVMLDLIALKIETAPFMGRLVAEKVSALVKRRGLDPASLAIDFGLDPLGDIARTGQIVLPWTELSQRVANTVSTLQDQGFKGPMLRIDARAFHEAGAGEAQELAAALAVGVAYLRTLEAHGHSLESARDLLSFLLVADAGEFLSVAKLRAMRRLWARIEQACGLEPKPIRLHAETAWRMTTRRDPWVNMLRTTVAAFSAGIGGADGITVLPFTAALGLPDAFARRIARNTQLILLDESNLARVADPAAGAGGFEALTDALCEKAWALFQEIEREGGILESLKGDKLQARIAAVRAQREKAAATRKEPITGTSEFPNIGEAEVSVLFAAPNELSSPLWGGDGGGGVSDSLSGSGANTPTPTPPHKGEGKLTIAPLPSIRTAEPFERLRDRADAHFAKTGTRPRIFLANLGPIAAFTARSTFAKNFFEAGGIEAITNDGFSDQGKLRQAYLDSKAKLCCICSTDEIYENHAVETTETLRSSGSTLVYLAGRQGNHEDAWKGAGITTFIFAGCDTLKVLSQALDEACA